MYDTAITLSEKILDDGTLTQESRERTDRSIKLYLNRITRTVTFSGKRGQNENALISHAEAMALEAIGLGVDSSNVYVEPESLDTVGQALFTKINITLPHEWKNLVIVSHHYHIPRLEEIFTFTYGPEFKINYVGIRSDKDSNAEIREAQERSLDTFRKTFQGIQVGDTQGILERLLERHPLYNNGKFNHYRSLRTVGV